MSKPLRALVLHRNQWIKFNRIEGQFQYPVPEFTWEQRAVDVEFRMDLKSEARGFDFVWLDEGKYGRQVAHFAPGPGTARPMPVVQQVVNITLSQGHFEDRLRRAVYNADAVAVDHGPLERWGRLSRPAFHLSYATNEERYKPAEKDVDVGHYAIWGYTWERAALDAWLEGFCKRKGWTFLSNRGAQWDEHYPAALGRTKVVVNLNRTAETRPHRLMDVSACGGVLLTNPFSPVANEAWADGVHYVSFEKPATAGIGVAQPGEVQYNDGDCGELIKTLEWLLDGGNWERIAGQARQEVLSAHTWRVRAPQLRQKLAEALGL